MENVATYCVWRKQRADGSVTAWLKTAHEISARTDREAEWKLAKRFLRSKFSLMSLVAVPSGVDPNQLSTTSQLTK